MKDLEARFLENVGEGKRIVPWDVSGLSYLVPMDFLKDFIQSERNIALQEAADLVKNMPYFALQERDDVAEKILSLRDHD